MRHPQHSICTACIAGLAFLACIVWTACASAHAVAADNRKPLSRCLFIDGKVYRLPQAQAQVMKQSSAIKRCAPAPVAAPAPTPADKPNPATSTAPTVRVIRSVAAPKCPCPEAPASTSPKAAHAAASHDWISAISLERGLDPRFVHAVIHVESRYNPSARSPMGALGLMQIMPATGARYGVSKPVDLLDPVTNVHVGTQYLRHLNTLFGRRVDLVAAAYNIGEGRVISNGYKVPQVAETQGYVRQVLAAYGQTP